MNFILINWVKYFTKETAKTLKVVTIGSAIVISIACIKYKPAYKVTISGETIGFINNRKIIEAKISKYINDTTGNIAFREINELPSYEFKLVNREKDIDEREVMLAVHNLTTTTYRTYAITSDGEQKAILATQSEAEQVINEIKSDLKEEVDLKLGIVEIYSTELTTNSLEDATQSLNEFKIAKVTEYENKKAEEAKAARIAAQKARYANASRAMATTATSGVSGNLSGMPLSIPVNGSITSRFGARGGSRASTHTGLDIATSLGTGIRPITSGTVTYAGYKGSYGNLIIIDHGNGVESYYAHCNEIYVSAGQGVDSSTTIGAVGSTGNSTGPHLHLEIRIGGSPVNPQNYLY